MKKGLIVHKFTEIKYISNDIEVFPTENQKLAKSIFGHGDFDVVVEDKVNVLCEVKYTTRKNLDDQVLKISEQFNVSFFELFLRKI